MGVRCRPEQPKSSETRQQKISDHQQIWGYEDGPSEGPGPPLCWWSLIFFLKRVVPGSLIWQVNMLTLGRSQIKNTKFQYHGIWMM
jgi:hypothetical protein